MPKDYKYRKTFTYEGIRYSVYGDTLDEVFEHKQKKLAELEAGTIRYSGNMLVKDWTYQALDTYKVNVNEDNLKNMKLRIEKHILSKIGNRTLKSVTAIQCQQILNDQEGMSYSHITKLHQELHFIFKMALRNRLIPFDPTEGLVVPTGTKGKRRSITDSERKHFLLACEKQPERFLFFHFMLYCGCRPSEVAEILWSDISVDGSQPLLHIRGTKTENSDRYVPIPAHYTSVWGSESRFLTSALTMQGISTTKPLTRASPPP